MIFVTIVCILTCLGLIALVFTKPSIKIGHEQISIYWLPPLFGALVLALEKYGVTKQIAELLSPLSASWGYGTTSFLAANLMNNIPMSVLFSGITADLTGVTQTAALYASIIGSNLGAFFTPIGALAGIMWMQLLRAHHIRLSFGKFTRYGTAVALPALLLAILGLVAVILKNKRTTEVVLLFMVETTGIEPVTPCMSSKYSNQLSYASTATLFYYTGVDLSTPVLNFFKELLPKSPANEDFADW